MQPETIPQVIELFGTAPFTPPYAPCVLSVVTDAKCATIIYYVCLNNNNTGDDYCQMFTSQAYIHKSVKNQIKG